MIAISYEWTHYRDRQFAIYKAKIPRVHIHDDSTTLISDNQVLLPSSLLLTTNIPPTINSKPQKVLLRNVVIIIIMNIISTKAQRAYVHTYSGCTQLHIV